MSLAQDLQGVISGQTPIVIEHQISIPPGKIIAAVGILLSAGIISYYIKNSLK